MPLPEAFPASSLLTPPPELVQEWADMLATHSDQAVFALAAQWGADQELEACIRYVTACGKHLLSSSLQSARRPQPPSLKEQALGAMGRFTTNAHTNADEMMRDFDTIRRALEQLDD